MKPPVCIEWVSLILIAQCVKSVVGKVGPAVNAPFANISVLSVEVLPSNPPEKIWICLINACMLHRWAELHLSVILSKFVHTCDPERIRCQLNHWKRNDAHSPWADLFPTVGYRIVYLAVVCVGISTPKNTNVNSYYIILPLSKRLILGLNKH